MEAMLEEIHTPEGVAEAVDILASRKSVGIIAGGTLVMGEFNTHPNDLLELVSLSQLGTAIIGVSVNGNAITIGAATPLSDLEAEDALEFLHPALETIGSPTLRNMATVGGNFFAANGYGDLATCLIALGAKCIFQGPNGERSIEAEKAVQSIKPDEILARVEFSKPIDGSWKYLKAMRRQGNSVSLATVAALVDVQSGIVASARVAIGGAGSTPVRATNAEQTIIGKSLDYATAEAAGEAAKKDVTPYTDAHASAWYRERVLSVYVRRALIGE